MNEIATQEVVSNRVDRLDEIFSAIGLSMADVLARSFHIVFPRLLPYYWAKEDFSDSIKLVMQSLRTTLGDGEFDRLLASHIDTIVQVSNILPLLGERLKTQPSRKGSAVGVRTGSGGQNHDIRRRRPRKSSGVSLAPEQA